jgi:hypothetical protein
MRTLEKPEFLKLLKEVSMKLDANSIRNEIPFVHKDKMNYDFIKILIPQETDIDIISTIFDGNSYVLKEQYIDFVYKDFRIVFIRTPENEFLTTFFYYSWDILPTLMNVMFNKFGLDLQPKGLRYVVDEKTFFVSDKLKYMLDFLDLNSNEYFVKGFSNLFQVVSFISVSKYFNYEIFMDYSISEKDYFYKEKKVQYNYALSLFKKFDEVSFKGFEYSQNLDDYILNIHEMFPNCNFLENVLKLKTSK